MAGADPKSKPPLFSLSSRLSLSGVFKTSMGWKEYLEQPFPLPMLTNLTSIHTFRRQPLSLVRSKRLLLQCLSNNLPKCDICQVIHFMNPHFVFYIWVEHFFGTCDLKSLIFTSCASIRITNGTWVLRKDRISTSVNFFVKKLMVVHMSTPESRHVS